MEKRYPITMMCAACIPWTEDFRFDEESFRREVKNIVDHGAKSIYIMGTAGEGYCLDNAMFLSVVEAFVDECGKGEGVMPMTGIISTSMPEMIERITLARELGCRDFQIALPCWGELSDGEVTTFFKTVCGSFPDCRFVCYNNGPRSKTKVTVEQFVRLGNLIPNLVGVKYSTPNVYEIYDVAMAETPLTFFLVDCGYTFGAPLGPVGFLNSFASVNFDLSWKYFRAGQEGDLKTLLGLGKYFMELIKAFGCVKGSKMDSALDKSIERVADGRFSNTLYPPYEGLSEEEFRQVDASMKATVQKYLKLYP